MAACGLQHIFEKPLPENPTLIESLSWNHIKSMSSIDHSSFTEIFGELHFKETPDSSSSSLSSSSASSSSSLTDLHSLSEQENSYKNNEELKKCSSADAFSRNTYKACHKNSDSFSSMNSESLQLCTEGLGFESSFDMEDLKNEMKDVWESHEKERAVKHSPSDSLSWEIRRTRMRVGSFPPPISCIGKSGKPGVCLKSFRQNGRFVLKEVRVPTQEFLHACREDGRLKLHFVQPEDDIPEEDDQEDNAEEMDDDNDCEEEEDYAGDNNEEKKEALEN